MKNVGQSAGQPMKIIEVVPFGETFDVGIEPAAKKRNEAKTFRRLGGMEAMQRLEPEERELDGMFALVCVGSKEARGFRMGREMLDKFRRASDVAERRDVIAPIKIPFEGRTVSHAEDQVGISERFFEQRPESGGVGAQADAEIDVGRDNAKQGSVGWGLGQVACRK